MQGMVKIFDLMLPVLIERLGHLPPRIVRIERRASRRRLQPLLRHQRQQLQRGTPRALRASFPLAHEAGGDVQIARKDRLTRLFPEADRADLRRAEVLHGRQTPRVERLHGPFRHDARLGQAERGFMDRG